MVHFSLKLEESNKTRVYSFQMNDKTKKFTGQKLLWNLTFSSLSPEMNIIFFKRIAMTCLNDPNFCYLKKHVFIFRIKLKKQKKYY